LLEVQRVEGKRCCVVEDVLSTGREMDLTALLIFLSKGQLDRVACLYDLQIASPLLIREERIFALCRPSAKIGYERLAKHKGLTESERDNGKTGA
jgi:orotate phosphoribosyltransferase